MNLNLMDPKLIAGVVVVILAIVVAVALYVRKRKSTTAELRDRFGPEYQRAVQTHGSERRAEAKLADREKRVEKLNPTSAVSKDKSCGFNANMSEFPLHLCFFQCDR
jgi:hypothetical protein